MSNCCNGASFPQVTRPAPAFSTEALVGTDIKKVSLSDYKGKWVVLVFYPLDFTFVCPTEIWAFNDRAKEFRDKNAEILLVSVDSCFSHLAWTQVPREKGGLGGALAVPVLSDLTHSISESYAVYMSCSGHSSRSTFIIDPQGVLQHITMNAPPVGRSVDETLRVLNAFQFVAEHGEVCPANWTPGSKTMSADPVKSQSYFGSKH